MVYMQTFMPSVNVSARVLVRECESQGAKVRPRKKHLLAAQKQPSEKQHDSQRQPHPNKNPAEKEDAHSSIELPGK